MTPCYYTPLSTLTVNLTYPESPTQIIIQTPEDSSSSPLSAFPTYSLIKTLQPYCSPYDSTISLHSTPSSSCPHPSTTPTSKNLLSTLFSPTKMHFFAIPLTNPTLTIFYSSNNASESKVSFCNCLNRLGLSCKETT